MNKARHEAKKIEWNRTPHNGFRRSISQRALRAATIVLCLYIGLQLCLPVPTSNARPLTDIRKSGFLVISVVEGHPPYSYADHEDMIGFDISLAKLLAEKIGVKPQFVTRKGPALRNYEADLAMNVAIWPQRNMSVTGHASTPPELSILPYHGERLILVSAKPKNTTGTATLSAKNNQIGVVANSHAHVGLMAARQTSNTAIPEILAMPNFARLLDTFQSAQISALAAPASQIRYIGQSVSGRFHLVLEKTPNLPVQVWQLGIAVPQKYESLIAHIMVNLGSLESAGELLALKKKYALPISLPPQ